MNKEAEKSPNVLVIELVNQQDSNYIMDPMGTGDGMDNVVPQPISCPSARKIKSNSVIVRDGRHVKIRYIAGCDEIEVEKQMAMGVTPNPPVDVIWITHGKLTCSEVGAEVGKYRYLKNYEGNVDNPLRPQTAEQVFREINTAIVAEKVEETYDVEFEIMRYLSALKTKVSDTQTTYNEERLAFLCSLFKLPPFDVFASEAWVALVEIAKGNPTMFLSRIKAENKLVEETTQRALAYGILKMDRNKAVLADNNRMVRLFREGMNDTEKIEALVDYLSSPKNKELYQELQTQVEMKKEAALAVH